MFYNILMFILVSS